jgi:hypothetical protein
MEIYMHFKLFIAFLIMTLAFMMPVIISLLVRD